MISEQSVDLEAQVEVFRLHHFHSLLRRPLKFFTLAQRIAQLIKFLAEEQLAHVFVQQIF